MAAGCRVPRSTPRRRHRRPTLIPRPVRRSGEAELGAAAGTTTYAAPFMARRLRLRDRTAMGVHDLGSQVDQHRGDVDAHRADLEAGAAQRRRVRQRVDLGVVADAAEQRVEDRADRTWVDRAVRVPADPLVDRADVEAGGAADAAQRLAADLVGQRPGAAVVEEYDVHLLRPVARGDAGPHGGVGVHPLAGRGARQQPQQRVQLRPGRHDLLDADDRDEDLRQGQAHPAVALGLDDDEGAGLGDREVRPGDRHLRAQELLAQVGPRRGSQIGGLVGQVRGRRPARLGHVGEEDLADLGPVPVDRRHQDVRGQVVAELDDQLREVGLPRRDAGCGERLVEPDLLGDHRLDLDDLVGVVRLRDRGNDRVGLGGVVRPVHGGAVRGQRLLQAHQVAVERAERWTP